MKIRCFKRATACIALCLAITTNTQADSHKSKNLEARVSKLEEQLKRVLGELETTRKERDALKAQQSAVVEEIAEMQDNGYSGQGVQKSLLPSGLRIGAYGEHHYNFQQGDDTAGNSDDQSDIHRFVAFLGYDFNDWITFKSETEIEHGFVNSSDGDLVIEQFLFDFNLQKRLNARIGRTLHPAGIINRYHEPTSFYGVERPTYSTNILPSTWSIDGAGFWGALTDWFSYEIYLHAGLDGSNMSEASGIRGGRLKERPGLNDYGVSGRIDVRPLIMGNYEGDLADWRLGFSYSNVGLANADQGADSGRVDSDVSIYAFDTDLRLGRVDLRSEAGYLDVSNLRNLNTAYGDDVSDKIFGWYAEAAVHMLPDIENGKLKDSDLVAFARYGESNTQGGNNPGGGLTDPTDNDKELTVGLSFYPVHNLVLKADYVFTEDQSSTNNPPNRLNFGIGYEF